MKHLILIVFIAFNLTSYHCNGQINILDRCGLDSSNTLNEYEIKVIDSIFFSPIVTRKSTFDPKSGFDFNNKKIAFYSCSRNSNSNGNGLFSKEEFFSLFKPKFHGHAGNGIIIFNENEKKESNGFDAVVIIDCPYDHMVNEYIIKQLKWKYE